MDDAVAEWARLEAARQTPASLRLLGEVSSPTRCATTTPASGLPGIMRCHERTWAIQRHAPTRQERQQDADADRRHRYQRAARQRGTAPALDERQQVPGLAAAAHWAERAPAGSTQVPRGPHRRRFKRPTPPVHARATRALRSAPRLSTGAPGRPTGRHRPNSAWSLELLILVLPTSDRPPSQGTGCTRFTCTRFSHDACPTASRFQPCHRPMTARP